jgi:hypothetical protein
MDFPNLIAGAFDSQPGTAFWTPIGFCVGALSGAVVQAIQIWNSSRRT